MATIGQRLSELLRANGVPGPIIHIAGGPHDVMVAFYRLDGEGKKYTDERGNLAIGTTVLDLHQDAEPVAGSHSGEADRGPADVEDVDYDGYRPRPDDG